jgi:hypothetical protein
VTPYAEHQRTGRDGDKRVRLFPILSSVNRRALARGAVACGRARGAAGSGAAAWARRAVRVTFGRAGRRCMRRKGPAPVDQISSPSTALVRPLASGTTRPGSTCPRPSSPVQEKYQLPIELEYAVQYSERCIHMVVSVRPEY